MHKVARTYCNDELMIVSTALADTIVHEMNLPPSMAVDYLQKFNEKCDSFRMDDEQYKEAKRRLDEEYGMNMIVNKLNKEEIEDE